MNVHKLRFTYIDSLDNKIWMRVEKTPELDQADYFPVFSLVLV